MVMWWLGLLIFVGFAGVIVATLERVWGRPIPQGRHSRAVMRNRAYVAVPLAMAAFGWTLVRLWLAGPGLEECGAHREMLWCLGGLLGLMAMAGWIVYWLLECCLGVAWLVRITFRRPG